MKGLRNLFVNFSNDRKVSSADELCLYTLFTGVGWVEVGGLSLILSCYLGLDLVSTVYPQKYPEYQALPQKILKF